MTSSRPDELFFTKKCFYAAFKKLEGFDACRAYTIRAVWFGVLHPLIFKIFRLGEKSIIDNVDPVAEKHTALYRFLVDDGNDNAAENSH